MSSMLEDRTWTRRLDGKMPVTFIGGVLDDSVFSDVIMEHDPEQVERLERLQELVANGGTADEIPSKTQSIPIECISEIGLPKDQTPFVSGSVGPSVVKFHIPALSSEVVEHLSAGLKVRQTTRSESAGEVLSASLFSGVGAVICVVLINFFFIVDSGWDEYQGRGGWLMPFFQLLVESVGVVPLTAIPATVAVALCLRVAHRFGNRRQIPVLAVYGVRGNIESSAMSGVAATNPADRRAPQKDPKGAKLCLPGGSEPEFDI